MTERRDRDLRAVLLNTSRELLDEGGPSALSMREVARRAGVTHQAPYHYFQNREAILAAVVAEGFAELARVLRQASDAATTPDAPQALTAAAEAYIGFAIDHPGVFRVMFRPDMVDPARYPQVQEAGEAARSELDRMVVLGHGEDVSADLASLLWAMVHGLACLLLDGPWASEYPTAAQRHAFAQRIVKLAGEL